MVAPEAPGELAYGAASLDEDVQRLLAQADTAATAPDGRADAR